MNGTRTHDHQQAVVFARHDFVDALTGFGDQTLNRGTGNRKKANQMFWGRQHGDVLDALVVGLAGLIVGRRISIMLGGFHGSSLKAFNEAQSESGKKKPPGFGGWFWSSAQCLRSDLSTAGGA
jgi:hypothetical protein